MSVTRGAIIAAALLGLLAGAAATAEADHCVTRISIYGRSSLTPVIAPPYTAMSGNMCTPRTGDTAIAGDHTLPPLTDQIMVRVNGDFGPWKPTLRLELTGLGWGGDAFVLPRTNDSLDESFTYHLPEWISVPEPTPGGLVTATVYYPDGPFSVTYRAGAVPVPTIPEPPSVG